MQFGKTFDPISSRSKRIDEDDEKDAAQKNEGTNSENPWKDEED